MGLFNKKRDPISERSKTLKAEIAALEAQIQQLNANVHQQQQGQPRVRSTALPDGLPAPPSPNPSHPPKDGAREPVFESLDSKRPAGKGDRESGPGQENELGIRKSNLTGAWFRLKNHFRGPSANNPKLVTYLAAGSINGLRPLRYEKRVARNRFLGFLFLLLLILTGLFFVFVRNH